MRAHTKRTLTWVAVVSLLPLLLVAASFLFLWLRQPGLPPGEQPRSAQIIYRTFATESALRGAAETVVIGTINAPAIPVQPPNLLSNIAYQFTVTDVVKGSLKKGQTVALQSYKEQRAGTTYTTKGIPLPQVGKHYLVYGAMSDQNLMPIAIGTAIGFENRDGSFTFPEAATGQRITITRADIGL